MSKGKYVDYSRYPECMWEGMSRAQQEAAFSVGIFTQSSIINTSLKNFGYMPNTNMGLERILCGADWDKVSIEEWLEWIKTQGKGNKYIPGPDGYMIDILSDRLGISKEQLIHTVAACVREAVDQKIIRLS